MTAPAPPATPGRLRHLQLHLKVTDSGAIVVSTPQAVDWATPVRGPEQLWLAMRAAFDEARRAGHAAWAGGGEPDGPAAEALDAQRPLCKVGVSWSRTAAARPDLTDTGDWTPLPDGSWLSPGGYRYRAPRVLHPIIARRAALGFPTSFEAAAERYWRALCNDATDEAEVAAAARFWSRVQSVDPVSASRWHTSDKRNRARVAS